MGRAKFSLLAILLTIAFLAIAFASLRHPSPGWSAICFAEVGLSLLLATLAGVFQDGDSRRVATGYALFGWAWFLLFFVPDEYPNLRGHHTRVMAEACIGTVYSIFRWFDPNAFVYAPGVDWFGRIVLLQANLAFAIAGAILGLLIGKGSIGSRVGERTPPH